MRVFGDQAFELTFVFEKPMSPGIVKRRFLLRNMKSEQQPRKITHLQNTRWEDDHAEADEEHFEDMDNLIKKIKAVR